MVNVPIYTKAEMDAQLDRISALQAELETVKGERDEARRSNREARAIISATHKRAVTHQNCQRHSCPICEGGLFQCVDCGAAEIETEQRVCTGPAAEAKLAAKDANIKMLGEQMVTERLHGYELLERAERAEAQLAEANKALEEAEFWLSGALDCKEWGWDADQREAATSSLANIRAAREAALRGDAS